MQLSVVRGVIQRAKQRQERSYMKTWLVMLLVMMSLSAKAEPFCGAKKEHPIDIEFEHDMQLSGGVTAFMRDAQVKAYNSWDKKLNSEYKELLALLAPAEKDTLKHAQRAWLAFRDAEIKLWWTESIAGDGSLAPVIVSSHSLDLLKERVCTLMRYKSSVAN